MGFFPPVQPFWSSVFGLICNSKYQKIRRYIFVFNDCQKNISNRGEVSPYFFLKRGGRERFIMIIYGMLKVWNWKQKFNKKNPWIHSNARRGRSINSFFYISCKNIPFLGWGGGGITFVVYPLLISNSNTFSANR